MKAFVWYPRLRESVEKATGGGCRDPDTGLERLDELGNDFERMALEAGGQMGSPIREMAEVLRRASRDANKILRDTRGH